MADEDVMGATSPAPSDHKRKLEDLEPEAPEPHSANGNGISQTDDAVNGDASEDSDAKRPRLDLDENPDGLVNKENGYEEEKTNEPKEEVPDMPAVVSNSEPEHSEQQADVAQETVDKEAPTADDSQTEAPDCPPADNPQSDNTQEASAEGGFQEPNGELQDPVPKASQLENVSSKEEQPVEGQLTSRKMEVPSNKVGVLIGKAGDTIRTLQNNSGARIQITRDSDADPSSGTRPVELIGSLESINKAEKLIKDVIAEADAGGSPSLVARGFNAIHSSGASEQIQLQVPNEKVGLIIGKGGETIKSLQTRSGARIQLIPQHLPEGDQSKERTVRVTGDKKQIEMARELIKEAMSQPVRSSNSSGGYNQQQGFRPRGPAGPQWGPRGPPPSQQIGYDYQQRGSFKSQNPQYPTPGYGNYPPHQGPPRSNFGWEQRPPTNVQGPPPQTGYDYYGGQGGHTGAPPSAQMPNPMHGHAPASGMGPPPSQAGYNYGQPQAPEYGQPAPYSQNAPPPQGYGQPGYGQQDQYGKPPSYNMPQQGPYAQPYGQPRPSQPGDVPYQGPVAANQSYGPNAAPPQQQAYPYGPTGQVQQGGYPPYGSAPTNDGYNQAAGYPQQVAQPVAAGYTQPAVQAPGYAQAGPAGGYGQYPPSAQTGYTEQAAPQSNAGYGGYQGVADPNYATPAGAAPAYGAPPTGQPGYAQPAPAQPGYDQSGYPQQYDASQMYAGHR